MRLKGSHESWAEYLWKWVIRLILTALAGLILTVFGIFGEGVQLWAAKMVYKLFKLKTKPYKQWEEEQEKERKKKEREEREKQKKLAKENQEKEKLLPTVVNNPAASRENGPVNFRWIIDGWIAAGDIGQIVAPTKCGKTTLSVPLAYAMAKGETTLLNPEAETLKQQVVYYQLDMREESFRNDYPNMDDYYPMIECCIKNGGVDVDVLIEHIRERALSTGQAYVTIFVDNINKVNRKARLVAELENLREELKKGGKTLTSILLNHTVKEYSESRYYKPITTGDIKGDDDNAVNGDFLITMNHTRESKDVKIITQRLRRSGETKDESIVVRRVNTPYCHFERLREAYEADMLPLKKKNGDAKDVSSVSEVTHKRGKNLGLTPEQIERIVEIYHACGDNLNAASRAVGESTEELLKDIKSFAPTQVDRLLKKYKKQQENNDF